MGELEKLRQAREAMSELFLLAPYMWQEWAKDEASLTTRYLLCSLNLIKCLICGYCLHRSEAVDAIKKLYE